ncbi:daunorubicin resistance protein DrrA family ABC transporter ATP-binding protein [Flexivirga endophytica]|uniref:Daunorubicin resistance protein DrrA family ABC transporter ATP-binding protein n=2 Tax=Flexivirga endophytica TaxID=1849103 RepID=A0A916T0U5_9MICO|nr:daunorubicin resistance protein DrrA family ABC transporter ATP-binding protein [Flexivirga endophytica]GHB53978.1 daunorubicin resistance protein DrrA family ABC transporter ATP-binding protein [Flexivirga endophytica]
MAAMTPTPVDRGPAVDVRDLTVRFGEFVAVDGVSFTVPTGSVLGLLGPNGAGKTTIVRVLATLLPATSGTAGIFGHDVRRDPHAVREVIGVTGQYASVDEELTARENLLIFARLLRYTRAGARRRCDELLEEFALSDAADRALKNFSGGMRRRLDLATSLIAEPPLIFLDEPTTGLDPRTRQQMWATVRRLVDGGSTVVLTTQYLEEADQLADNIVVIDHGRVVAEGSADHLKSSVGTGTLRLVLRDGAERATAGSVMEQLAGHQVEIDSDGSLAVPVNDASLVTDVLIGLRDKGIEVDDVGVHKPTLDEVFFQLTGNREDTV